MDILMIISIICIGSVLLTALLHYLFKNSKNKFATFINNIWFEWFEQQWNGLIAFILFIGVALLIGLMLR